MREMICENLQSLRLYGYVLINLGSGMSMTSRAINFH